MHSIHMRPSSVFVSSELYFLYLAPQFLHQQTSVKHFSSVPRRRTTWNSPTNVVITNPVLLAMEDCSSMHQLKKIQAQMTITGLISHTFPASRVLAFCALSDSGDINYALTLFSQIEEPNTFMWNTMIRGYSMAGNPSIGISWFSQMVKNRVEMDRRSFVFALKASEQFEGTYGAEYVHCTIWKMGVDSDVLVQNGLINAYSKFGCISVARKVFDECPVRDVVTWTSMIGGYAGNSFPNEAIELFDSMMSSGVNPNEVTVIAVLSACSQKRDLVLGESVHQLIRKESVSPTLNLLNALLDMYIKCGCLIRARDVFDTMATRDVFSWTSMVNGYSKFGDLDAARKVFDEMPMKNIVSWNAMIAGYSQNNQPDQALSMFHDMLESGLVPNENTLVCVLSACGQMGSLDIGIWFHNSYIVSNVIPPSVVISNALIDMYAKCGHLDGSVQVFDEMPERDIVSWNSMIKGFAVHGHAYEALSCFERLKLIPDDITYVGVLSACNHAGLLAEGREYFEKMEIEPKVEHYGCMIDLYSRNGLLEEAYEMVRRMPMEPSKAILGALLNACRVQGNVEMAKLIGRKLLEMDPEDSGVYSILATIYAGGKEWSGVRMIRCVMREKSVRKNPGRSLIEVEGKVHEFLAADESHPRFHEIYRALTDITLQLASELDVE